MFLDQNQPISYSRLEIVYRQLHNSCDIFMAAAIIVGL